jgi:hypothetical protein
VLKAFEKTIPGSASMRQISSKNHRAAARLTTQGIPSRVLPVWVLDMTQSGRGTLRIHLGRVQAHHLATIITSKEVDKGLINESRNFENAFVSAREASQPKIRSCSKNEP